MSLFNIFWHRVTNEVTVQPATAEAPLDADHIGEHQHPDGKDVREAHLGLTLFHIIRDLLHQHGPVNMQSVKLTVNDQIVDSVSSAATAQTAESKGSTQADCTVASAETLDTTPQVISNLEGSETTQITDSTVYAAQPAASTEETPS